MLTGGATSTLPSPPMARQVQICHNSMLTARKGLPGHLVYGRVRNACELLESLNLLQERKGQVRLTYVLKDIQTMLEKEKDKKKIKLYKAAEAYSELRKNALKETEEKKKKQEAEEQKRKEEEAAVRKDLGIEHGGEDSEHVHEAIAPS